MDTTVPVQSDSVQKDFIDTIVKKVEEDFKVGGMYTFGHDIKAFAEEWRSQNQSPAPDEVNWEIWAMEMCTRHRDGRREDPDVCLAPMMIFEGGRGYPDVSALLGDDRAIEYFLRRADETKNPFRRSRYEEILWEALRRRKDRTAHQHAKKAASSYLEQCGFIVQQGKFMALDFVLDRAAELAAMLRQEDILTQVVDLLRETLLQAPPEERHRLVCGYGRTLRFINAKAKGFDTGEVWKIVLEVIEAGIKHHMATPSRNITILEHLMALASDASSYLVRHPDAWNYQVQIAELYESEAKERETRQGGSGGKLVGFKFMESAVHRYNHLSSIAPDETEKLRMMQKSKAAQSTLRRLIREGQGEMNPITTQVEIPTEELESCLVEPLLEAGKNGGDVLFAMSCHPGLLLRVDRLREQAKEDSGKFIFQKLVARAHFRDARKVGESPAMQDDIDISFHLDMWFQTHWRFLDFVFARLKEEGLFTKEIFIERFKNWELVDERDIPFIQQGLERYFADDHISALHILVPRIEHILKSAFERDGVDPSVVESQEKIREQLFGAFLTRAEIRGVLGEDLFRYIYSALADEIGLNLRNDVAHGWIEAGSCNRFTVQLVLFIILQLTRIQLNRTDS